MTLRLLSAALFLFLARSNRAAEHLASSLATSLVQDTEAPTPFLALPSFGLPQVHHNATRSSRLFQRSLPQDSPEVVNNARVPPTCVWNPAGQKCSLDKWYILSQLEESKSELAKVYTTFLVSQLGFSAFFSKVAVNFVALAV